jgi:hypothetical protein
MLPRERSERANSALVFCLGQEEIRELPLSFFCRCAFTNSGVSTNSLGLNPVGFDVHVYAINADMGAHGLINLKLAVNVPKGTFTLANSQANGQTYSVPFTEVGLKCTY